MALSVRNLQCDAPESLLTLVLPAGMPDADGDFVSRYRVFGDSVFRRRRASRFYAQREVAGGEYGSGMWRVFSSKIS